MIDAIITILADHYVVAGILILSIGVLVNLAFTAGPEIAEHFRMHKLY